MSNIITVDGIEYGPVTKLDDLPRVEYVTTRDRDGFAYAAKAILESSLTSRCLVRDSEDDTMAKLYHDAVAKVDQLTARVAELERKADSAESKLSLKELELQNFKGETRYLYKYVGSQMLMSDFRTADEMREALNAARAELSALREQQTLGEELSWEQWESLDDDAMVIRHDVDDDDWDVGKKGVFEGPNPRTPGSMYYWPWTPPVLSSPVEEVPGVLLSHFPSWIKPGGVLGVVGYYGNSDHKFNGAYGVVLESYKCEGEDGFSIWWSETPESIEIAERPDFTGWRAINAGFIASDGKTVTIEPTAELLAALQQGASDAQ